MPLVYYDVPIDHSEAKSHRQTPSATNQPEPGDIILYHAPGDGLWSGAVSYFQSQMKGETPITHAGIVVAICGAEQLEQEYNRYHDQIIAEARSQGKTPPDKPKFVSPFTPAWSSAGLEFALMVDAISGGISFGPIGDYTGIAYRYTGFAEEIVKKRIASIAFTGSYSAQTSGIQDIEKKTPFYRDNQTSYAAHQAIRTLRESGKQIAYDASVYGGGKRSKYANYHHPGWNPDEDSGASKWFCSKYASQVLQMALQAQHDEVINELLLKLAITYHLYKGEPEKVPNYFATLTEQLFGKRIPLAQLSQEMVRMREGLRIFNRHKNKAKQLHRILERYAAEIYTAEKLVLANRDCNRRINLACETSIDIDNERIADGATEYLGDDALNTLLLNKLAVQYVMYEKRMAAFLKRLQQSDVHSIDRADYSPESFLADPALYQQLCLRFFKKEIPIDRFHDEVITKKFNIMSSNDLKKKAGIINEKVAIYRDLNEVSLHKTNVYCTALINSYCTLNYQNPGPEDSSAMLGKICERVAPLNHFFKVSTRFMNVVTLRQQMDKAVNFFRKVGSWENAEDPTNPLYAVGLDWFRNAGTWLISRFGTRGTTQQSKVDLKKNSYRGQTLQSIDYSGSNLQDCDFRKACLTASDFSFSQCRGMKLKGARVRGTIFEGVPADYVRFCCGNIQDSLLAIFSDYKGRSAETRTLERFIRASKQPTTLHYSYQLHRQIGCRKKNVVNVAKQQEIFLSHLTTLADIYHDNHRALRGKGELFRRLCFLARYIQLDQHIVGEKLQSVLSGEPCYPVYTTKEVLNAEFFALAGAKSHLDEKRGSGLRSSTRMMV